jgi:hypothetical protein
MPLSHEVINFPLDEVPSQVWQEACAALLADPAAKLPDPT